MASIHERIDKDGKTRYRVQIRLRGSRPQVATFDRKTDAKRWIQEVESGIREGRHFKTNESKKHTLNELIDRYIREIIPEKKKSGPKQKAQLEWWKAQIGHTLLCDVTPQLIAEQRDKLKNGVTYRGSKRSPSTVVRYLAALSHAFTIAVREWAWLEVSPTRNVTKPTEPRGRVRFLSDEERARLLQVCKESSNPYLYTVIVIALATGMRQAEIMNLTWADVDLAKGRIVLHETKNGEIRVVPIAGLALQLLREHDRIRRVDSVLLFPGNKNPRLPVDLRSPWERALKLAGLSNFRFHDLRHSAASYLVMNGASLTEVSEILGHKTLSMVKRYAHLSEAHTAGVVASMNEKIFGRNN